MWIIFEKIFNKYNEYFNLNLFSFEVFMFILEIFKICDDGILLGGVVCVFKEF